HLLDDLHFLLASCHIGLIGDHDKNKPRFHESPRGFDHARQQFKILDPVRWMGDAIPDDVAVNDPITVKEDSSAWTRRRSFMLFCFRVHRRVPRAIGRTDFQSVPAWPGRIENPSYKSHVTTRDTGRRSEWAWVEYARRPECTWDGDVR